MPTDDTDEERDERPSVRQILSKNVRALIDDARESRPHLGSILKVADTSKKLTHGSSTLSKSRVGRIVTGSHPTDVDALTDLANVFGLQPWQLLVENLNPKALPRLADSSLLSQIRQIVDSVPAADHEVPPSPTHEPALQPSERKPKIGPALKDAFDRGMHKNAGNKSAAATKREGRRSGKGASDTRRGR